MRSTGPSGRQLQSCKENYGVAAARKGGQAAIGGARARCARAGVSSRLSRRVSQRQGCLAAATLHGEGGRTAGAPSPPGRRDLSASPRQSAIRKSRCWLVTLVLSPAGSPARCPAMPDWSASNRSERLGETAPSAPCAAASATTSQSRTTDTNPRSLGLSGLTNIIVTAWFHLLWRYRPDCNMRPGMLLYHYGRMQNPKIP